MSDLNEMRRTLMSNEANVVLKERCYAEAIEEVDNMTLKQLKSVIKIHPDTQQRKADDSSSKRLKILHNFS